MSYYNGLNTTNIKKLCLSRLFIFLDGGWGRKILIKNLKLSIVGIFFIFMFGISKVFAADATISFGDNVAELIQISRKMVLIIGLGLICISFLLALFKKASWFYFLCTSLWLAFFICLIIYIDYIPIDDYYTQEFWELCSLMLCILLLLIPLLTSFIQYKRKKIEKKLLKRRVFTWFLPIIVFFFAVIFRFIFI